MGRKPIPNPSAATLRKRKQRGTRLVATPAPERPALDALIAKAVPRLVPVTVHVPPQDVKAIQLAAERFRRIARIPDSEVPE